MEEDKKTYTQAQFIELLNRLMQETGWNIIPVPELKLTRNGEYVTVAKLAIVQTKDG